MLTLNSQVKAVGLGQYLPGEDYPTIYAVAYDPAAISIGSVADVVKRDIVLPDPDRAMMLRLFSHPV